jgi:hypothetical protein
MRHFGRESSWRFSRIAYEWFAEGALAVAGVGVRCRVTRKRSSSGLREGRKVVCLKVMSLFRGEIGKLPDMTVFTVFNGFGRDPPSFVALPRFVGAQRRFAAYHRGRSSSLNQIRMGVGRPLLRVRRTLLRKYRPLPRGEGMTGRATRAGSRSCSNWTDAEAMRNLEGPNATGALFPHAPSQCAAARGPGFGPRFMSFMSAESHQFMRDTRLLANAFAERAGGMETAGETHLTLVSIVQFGLEARDVVASGSITGLGSRRCPAHLQGSMIRLSSPTTCPGLWLVPHSVRGLLDEMPASDRTADDDLLHTPRPCDFVPRLTQSRRRNHRFAPATPRSMVAEPVKGGQRAPMLLASYEAEKPLALRGGRGHPDSRHAT